MDLHQHGTLKFPNAGLHATSRNRGWQGIAAELRSHPAGNLPALVPTQLEITLATRRCAGAHVSRKGAGLRQTTAVEAGTVWLCPVGVGEDDTNISAPLTDILHIYLPADRFGTLNELYGDSRIRADNVRYLADVDDPLIKQLGMTILTELLQESSGGRMLVESAALALTARIAHAHGQSGPSAISAKVERVECPERIQRAVDYIRENPHLDITISELADICCLSPFHFARSFKRATGKTPHGLISEVRLNHARKLLADRKHSLADVALLSGFSNQSAFSNAFKKALGCTPGSYRQMVS
ncbi:AraC family transcriptional regulator [Methylobacterium sp. OAE515]|uniref:helix-turn-helix transcriptional regulator n=1 Tax=Methylobacterium sp. OAE515 TaxID=2817895 RepID=UPI00178B351E